VCRKVGIGMGRYHQVTMNAHVYLNDQGTRLMTHPYSDDRYADNSAIVSELPVEIDLFDRDLAMFMEDPAGDTEYRTDYFNHIVTPIYDSWRAWKEQGKQAGLNCLAATYPCDWQIACREWLQRRKP
jgi:hypothetical protein